MKKTREKTTMAVAVEDPIEVARIYEGARRIERAVSTIPSPPITLKNFTGNYVTPTSNYVTAASADSKRAKETTGQASAPRRRRRAG